MKENHIDDLHRSKSNQKPEQPRKECNMKRNKTSLIRNLMGSIALIAALFIFGGPVSIAMGATEQQVLVDQSQITLKDFVSDPNMEWLVNNVHTAKAVLIVPSMIKGGFFLGGSGGRGVLLVRDEKTGKWYGPGFYSLGAVSFGLQFGGQKAEVIMLVMTQKGLESLYTSSFKLGGDVAVAAGPVGAGASAKAAGFKADYLSYTRAKGAFLGFSLEGAIVKINDEWNQAYYGGEARPTDIFVTRGVNNPKAAELQAAVGNVRGSAKKAPVAAAKGGYHVVQSGDTLLKIAKKYDTSVDELCRLNNIGKDKPIYPGQKIMVTSSN
jgi:lipid-binding SYLF domain-containing protein